MPSRRLIQSSLIVLFFYALSKVTGFGRLILFTQFFGTSTEADALTAAVQLPELLIAMISGGALGAALIPIYSQFVVSERELARRRLAGTIVTMVTVALAVCCGLVAIAAPWLVEHLIVPSFSADSQQLTAQLMRYMMIALTIVGISVAISSLLNAHQHFALPALATVVIDLGYIAGLYLLTPTMGVFGVAYGAILGACLHLIVQIPAILKHRLHIRARLDWRDESVRRVGRLMLPRVATMGMVQSADLFILNIASRLPEGSVSIYYYALLLAILPSSLVAWAIGNVILPTLAEQFNAKNPDAMRQTATQALRALFAMLVPAVFGLIALGTPAIAFLFERGEFGADATALLYSLIVILGVRTISEGGLTVFERVLFAQHDTRTVMVGYAIWLGIYIGGAWLLAPSLGVRGLAVASSIAMVTLTLFLWVRCRLFLGSLSAVKIIPPIAIATVAMVGTMLPLHRLALAPLPFITLAISMGGIVYLLLFVPLARRYW